MERQKVRKHASGSARPGHAHRVAISRDEPCTLQTCFQQTIGGDVVATSQGSRGIVGATMPLVETMARHLHRGTGAALPDLLSDAYEGLVLAASSYDAERGVPFHLFAARRARFRMLDGLRSERLHTRLAHRLRALAPSSMDGATPPLTPEEALAG